jgi:hypothetical protein
VIVRPRFLLLALALSVAMPLRGGEFPLASTREALDMVRSLAFESVVEYDIDPGLAKTMANANPANKDREKAKRLISYEENLKGFHWESKLMGAGNEVINHGKITSCSCMTSRTSPR